MTLLQKHYDVMFRTMVDMPSWKFKRKLDPIILAAQKAYALMMAERRVVDSGHDFDVTGQCYCGVHVFKAVGTRCKPERVMPNNDLMDDSCHCDYGRYCKVARDANGDDMYAMSFDEDAGVLKFPEVIERIQKALDGRLVLIGKTRVWEIDGDSLKEVVPGASERAVPDHG